MNCSARGRAWVREYPHDHDQLFDRGDDLQLTATLATLDVADVTLSSDWKWPAAAR